MGALWDTAGTLWDPVVPQGAPLRGNGGGARGGRTALHRPIDPTDPRCAAPGLGGGGGGIGFRIGTGRGPFPPHWGQYGVMGRDRLWGRKSALGGVVGMGRSGTVLWDRGGRGRREKMRKKGKMEGKGGGGRGVKGKKGK